MIKSDVGTLVGEDVQTSPGCRVGTGDVLPFRPSTSSKPAGVKLPCLATGLFQDCEADFAKSLGCIPPGLFKFDGVSFPHTVTLGQTA